MASSYVDFFKDKRGKIVSCMVNTYTNSGVTRSVTIELGGKYIIDPINLLKKKHRGRICMVIGFMMDTYGTPADVRVKFLDTSRTGRISIRDIVPVDFAKKPDQI
ncbi:hypothetical protein DFP93_101185 [Aneurinibacillus soli]|uniref:Uncharacterized protein n=1 Tax=Aneurinibacillus soli TaxID=1500254 RepID=A0A0U5BBM7_9BACL|nr:hypothetical protein [Aneurinibacillus soli]PYE64160.1 hypothetical protein DFP93_101185 [Aneurinibacillus soli]BAU28109.1 hypothetical protein CB4_02283 [Aneurinibacillus soli]